MADEPRLISTHVTRQMDPRLQHAIARRQFGMNQVATSSTAHDEVAVIAKVTSVRKWKELSEVRVGADLGKSTAGDRNWLVTGRVPVSRIDNLRSLDFVKSLKAAQPIQPVLFASTQETNARPAQLPAQSMANGGAGCVVGVIDYGGDFAHQNFIGPDGKTRLIALWNQGASANQDSPFGYGREFTSEQIDAALATPAPYDALGYGPALDSDMPSPGTHGTHVMDIAAGNGRGSGVAGLAPAADLVFVHVSHSDIPFSGAAVVDSSFGDSVQLLEAAQYIFEKAGDRPCVINISLGTNGGPHDGTTLLEEGLDRLVQAQPNRAITIAASNSFDDGIHASGTLAQGQSVDLGWDIPLGDLSHNEFELWYSGADRFDVELITPGGTSLGTLSPGQNGSITDQGSIVLFVANRLDDPNNHDNMIGIFLERGVSSGRWTVRLHGQAVTDGGFHAWIERDNRMPSQFAPPHDNSHTIGSISCGHETIVVGSYDAHKASRPISFFSSAGPTRDGRQKPEISAPGHAVMAAHSRTETGVVRKSGTSMAAPAVCGIVALMLSEAAARGLSLSISQIRQILISTTRKSPPPGTAWNARFGNGRIDASAAVNDVIQMATGGGGTAIAAAVAAPRKAKRKRRRASAKGRKKRAVKT